MSLLVALASVLAGLASASAVGWAVSRAATWGLTLRERLAWALASGLIIQAFGLLVLLSLRARPSGWRLLLFDFALAALALALDRSRSRARVRVRDAARAAESRPTSRESWLVPILLYGVAALAWSIFLGEALADSMWATDFLAFWGYKGKVIALTAEIPRRLFQDPVLYFAHREYPMLVPLSLAALAAFGGRWNDQALALFYPACALATLLAVSGFLERRVSRRAAATATALAALCAFLYRPANAGTAEIPFALALVLACSAAIDFLKEDRASSAPRLALASLFCASLKQEGTLFVFLLAVVLAIHERRGDARRLRTALAALAALLTPAVAHWIVLYVARGNQNRRDFDFTLLEPRRWAELPELFGLVLGRFARIGWTEALVPILAIAIFFLVTRRGIGDALTPVFPVQILVYAIAFTVSSFDPLYAIDGAFRRIAMTMFPAFTLVLCAREIP